MTQDLWLTHFIHPVILLIQEWHSNGTNFLHPWFPKGSFQLQVCHNKKFGYSSFVLGLCALHVPSFLFLEIAGAFNHEVSRPTARANANCGTTASNNAYLSHPNHNINRSVPLPALQHPSIQGMVPAQSGHNRMVVPYSTISSYSGTGMSIASDIEVPMGMDAAAPSRYMRPLSIIGHTGHGERHSARHAHRRSHLIFSQHTAYNRLAPEVDFLFNGRRHYSTGSNLFAHHSNVRCNMLAGYFDDWLVSLLWLGEFTWSAQGHETGYWQHELWGNLKLLCFFQCFVINP